MTSASSLPSDSGAAAVPGSGSPMGARVPETGAEMREALVECFAEGMSTEEACALVGIQTRTLYKWLAKDAEFAAAYGAAKERVADKHAEDSLAIADGLGKAARHEDIGVAKLRIETRKWLAGVLRPKVYGPKAGVEVTGKNGGPIDVAIQVDFVGK